MLWFFIFLFLPGAIVSRQNCGGVFTDKRGILQTPNFPRKFQTPINCEWIIKAENRRTANTSIIVYFTQMYLYEGITFTEYVEYDKRYPIDGHVIAITDNIAKVNYVQCHRNVLVISLKLDSVDSNHLRVLDNFLDVYGFNITYEITNRDVREDHCNMMDCGFTGICYDYVTKFGCKCFEGYSGAKCSEGPKSGCFNPDGSPVCQNGANCTHVGDSYFNCGCAEGFMGENCDIPATTNECEDCVISCIYDETLENVCRCSEEQSRNNSDLQVYTSTVQLRNIPTLDRDDLRTYISEQISMSLRSNNTEVRNLKIISLESLQSEFEVTFRFYGSRRHENQLRSVINTWGEIGFIGNISVANPDVVLYKEPILSIQSVGISPEGTLHENEEFILSCSAQGSPNMSFRWYKDGIFVNVTRSKNNKWVTLREGAAPKTYIAILTIDRAQMLDQGVFTCQVEDYGVQQCLSKRVYVQSRPSVTLEPMSITVAKGESFSIKCLSHNHGNEHIYSWTKNGNLMPIKTKREHYDTLYPSGSLLQVSGLSKSANYSCLVQDRSIQSEMNIYVTLIDKKVIRMCETESRSNVTWPETAPGSENIQWCPSNYTGLARRSCRMLDANLPKWELPDMSSCISDVLYPIIMELDLLRLGYEATTPMNTMNLTLNYVRNGIELLDGEGSRILKLVKDLILYINDSKYLDTIDNFSDTYRFAENIISSIMLQNRSLINEQQVVELQQTMKNILFSAAKVLDYFSDTSSTVDTKIQPVDKLGRFLSYYIFSSTNIELKLPYITSDFGSIIFVVYKNLPRFLPARSVLRMNGSELEYEVITDIAASWYVDDHGEIKFSDEYTLRVEFSIMKSGFINLWNLSCAAADVAPFGYYWDTSVCKTQIVNTTTVNCFCKRFGTYTLIATKESAEPLQQKTHMPNRIIVLVGCTSCLFLAIFSGLILLFHWLCNKSCIVFLKIQYCLSTIGAMSVFILAHTNQISDASYLCLSTLLQIFLLTALSTQLSIVFVIYTDLFKFKSSLSIKPTSVCVITGAPIIVSFGNYLTYISTNIHLDSWWMVKGTVSFNVFIVCCSVLGLLFFTIYFITTKFISSNSKVDISRDRMVLLKSTMYIFHSIGVVIISSMLYANMAEELICHCMLSVTSILLGALMLFCYVIKSEIMLKQYFLTKITMKSKKEVKKDSLPSIQTTTLKAIKRRPNEEPNVPVNSPQIDKAKEYEQNSTSSKQLIVSLDNQKQIKSKIKTPDILNRENCVYLDLVCSNTKAEGPCQKFTDHPKSKNPSSVVGNVPHYIKITDENKVYSKQSLSDAKEHLLRDEALEICSKKCIRSSRNTGNGTSGLVNIPNKKHTIAQCPIKNSLNLKSKDQDHTRLCRHIRCEKIKTYSQGNISAKTEYVASIALVHEHLNFEKNLASSPRDCESLKILPSSTRDCESFGKVKGNWETLPSNNQDTASTKSATESQEQQVNQASINTGTAQDSKYSEEELLENLKTDRLRTFHNQLSLCDSLVAIKDNLSTVGSAGDVRHNRQLSDAPLSLTHDSTSRNSKSLDDVMCSISNDLNYLLDRTCDLKLCVVSGVVPEQLDVSSSPERML